MQPFESLDLCSIPLDLDLPLATCHADQRYKRGAIHLPITAIHGSTAQDCIWERCSLVILFGCPAASLP